MQAKPEAVELLLTGKPQFLNHVSTVHALTQYALAEATFGAMVVTAFTKLLGSGAGLGRSIAEQIVRQHG